MVPEPECNQALLGRALALARARVLARARARARAGEGASHGDDVHEVVDPSEVVRIARVERYTGRAGGGGDEKVDRLRTSGSRPRLVTSTDPASAAVDAQDQPAGGNA